jgi:hypothetical protein
MGKDISNLSSLMQRVVDLSAIDRWLRDMATIVPQHAQRGSLSGDFNRHSFSFSASGITPGDIESMVGFRHLLTACSQKDVRIDIRDRGEGMLEVAFDPEKRFSRSRVFGASYANVLPVLFGAGRGYTY